MEDPFVGRESALPAGSGSVDLDAARRAVAARATGAACTLRQLVEGA
ncbi:hypothetical protein [Streptomyces sp. NPDC090445]